jgi:hypothetical protein
MGRAGLYTYFVFCCGHSEHKKEDAGELKLKLKCVIIELLFKKPYFKT